MTARRLARNRVASLRVKGEMGVLRALIPFVRPLLLAGAVTALIMIGLPTFLAIAAAGAVR